MLLLLFTLLSHGAFQLLVMLVDLHLLLSEHLITLRVLTIVLLSLHLPLDLLIAVPINLAVKAADLSREVLV